MNWYTVRFSNDEVANGRHMALQDAFAKIFIQSGAPIDAGMFGSIAPGLADCYFSPGAARIAMPLIAAYHGVVCQAPRQADMAILVANHGFDGKPFAG